MTLTFGLIDVSIGVLLLSALQFLITLWISERFKISLQKEHALFMENQKWELKTREQATRVAEYLALARDLRHDSSEGDYRKANQMSWELAMWLPDDIYKEMVKAVANPDMETNELTTVIAVRHLLLQDKSGALTSENVAHHAPGIGNRVS